MWYGPIFGRAWLPLAHPGKTMKDIEAEENTLAYGVSMFAHLVSAYFLAHFLNFWGAKLIVDAMIVGAVAGVFKAILSAPHYAFGSKPLKLYLIDEGFDILGCVLNASVVFYVSTLV